MKISASIPVRISMSIFKGKPMASKTGKTITYRVFETIKPNSYSMHIKEELEIVAKHFEN